MWDTTPGMVPGSWGGHVVIIDGYDWTRGVPEFLDATWGTEQRMTEAFWRACGDEAFCLLLDTWVHDPPPGLDAAALQMELSALGRVIPGP